MIQRLLKFLRGKKDKPGGKQMTVEAAFIEFLKNQLAEEYYKIHVAAGRVQEIELLLIGLGAPTTERERANICEGFATRTREFLTRRKP